MDLKRIVLYIKGLQILGYIALASLLVYSCMFGWGWFLVSFLYYKFVVGLFSNQIAQHRYISHNSFKTGPKRHKFLAWVSILSGFSPVIYASIHRHHHVYSDTENDLHSPRVSFWHSAMGWTGNWGMSYRSKLRIKPAYDIMRDKTLWFVHCHGHKFFIALILLVSLLSWKMGIFVLLASVGWNHLHMGVLRSALVHIKLPGSYKNYELDDDSWNNQYLHYYDLGEGLHNNHHKYPNKYNQATKPGEFDFTGWLVGKLFI